MSVKDSVGTSMKVRDALGNLIYPGDIVVLGNERRPRGNVYIGVVFDFVETKTRYSGVTYKVRIKIPTDKGKTTPWGNTSMVSLTLSYGNTCHSIISIDMGNGPTKKQFGAAKSLSNYMAEKGRINRVEKIADEKAAESEGILGGLLSGLGAPKIEL